MRDVFTALVRNEVRSFFRNRIAAFWSLAFPLFLFVVLFVLHGADHLGVARIEIVDQARNAESAAAVALMRDEIRSQTMFEAVIAEATLGAPRARNSIRVIFPQDYGSAGSLPVRIEPGASESLVVQAAARILSQAILKADLVRSGTALSATVASAGPVPAAASHGQYLLGGVLVMIMMSTGLMSTTAVLAAMREHDVFKVYGALPVPRLHFLIAILSVRLVLIMMFCILLIAVGRIVFGIAIEIGVVRTSLAMLTVVAGSVAFLSVGLLLGARVSTIATATILSNLVYFPLLMLGDLTFPLQGLPERMQTILGLLPVNQLVAAMRALLFHTPDIDAVLRLCAGLFAGSAVLLAASSRLFRWTR